MRDPLVRLQGEHEPVARPLAPRRQRLLGREPAERVVDLDRRELRGVVVEHARSSSGLRGRRPRAATRRTRTRTCRGRTDRSWPCIMAGDDEPEERLTFTTPKGDVPAAAVVPRRRRRCPGRRARRRRRDGPPVHDGLLPSDRATGRRHAPVQLPVHGRGPAVDGPGAGRDRVGRRRVRGGGSPRPERSGPRRRQVLRRPDGLDGRRGRSARARPGLPRVSAASAGQDRAGARRAPVRDRGSDALPAGQP